MNSFKKYLLTALTASFISMSLSKLSIAEDLSPIDDHICNNILEFAQKENGGVKVPKIEILFKYQGHVQPRNESQIKKRVLALETYVFYGKCLLLQSTDPLEKEKGRTILQAMSDRLGNIPSAFFLAQYIEAENGHEDIQGIKEALSAYGNVIHLINEDAKDFSFGMKFARGFLAAFKHNALVPTFIRLAERRTGGLGGLGGLLLTDYFTNLQAPPLSPSLFVNSINENWWLISPITYYKIPQLHLISTIEELKKLPPDEIPEEAFTRNGQAQPRSNHYEDTFHSTKPAKQIIEDTIYNTIVSAESCISDLENYHPMESDKWEDLALPIHSACEELREIALDFSNGSRPMSLKEAENLEAFLQSQEEQIHTLIKYL